LWWLAACAAIQGIQMEFPEPRAIVGSEPPNVMAANAAINGLSKVLSKNKKARRSEPFVCVGGAAVQRLPPVF
jgi:hypothetical protein